MGTFKGAVSYANPVLSQLSTVIPCDAVCLGDTHFALTIPTASPLRCRCDLDVEQNICMYGQLFEFDCAADYQSDKSFCEHIMVRQLQENCTLYVYICTEFCQQPGLSLMGVSRVSGCSCM